MDCSAEAFQDPNCMGRSCKPGIPMDFSSILSMREALACSTRIRQAARNRPHRTEANSLVLSMMSSPGFGNGLTQKIARDKAQRRGRDTDVAEGFMSAALRERRVILAASASGHNPHRISQNGHWYR